MTMPRSDVFDPDTVGVYHCFSECVRQLFLLGNDYLTQTQNSHRRDFMVGRLKQLSRVMAVEVLDFSLMENHVHSLLRNRPDIAASWSAEEVGRRWWELCPGRKKKDGTPLPPKPSEIAMLVSDPVELEKLRERLSSISWWMWFWLGPIARMANREDEKRGHFFAGRFKCKRMEDEGSILACSMYTVLNPYRAGMVEAPEDYPHGSLAYRIAAQMERHRRELGEPVENLEAEQVDAWLAHLFLDPSASAYDAVVEAGEADEPVRRLVPQSHPFPFPRVSDKGYLPITLPDYVDLLRWTAENLRPRRGPSGPLPKHGEPTECEMPQPLSAMLSRLGVVPEYWLDTVQRFDELFHSVVGTAAQMAAAAERLGRQWLQGVTQCRARFHGRSADPPATG